MDIRVKPNLTIYDKLVLLCKNKRISSFWWSAIYGWEMGKCGVFISFHSHQVIPISIPM